MNNSVDSQIILLVIKIFQLMIAHYSVQPENMYVDFIASSALIYASLLNEYWAGHKEVFWMICKQ